MSQRLITQVKRANESIAAKSAFMDDVSKLIGMPFYQWLTETDHEQTEPNVHVYTEKRGIYVMKVTDSYEELFKNYPIGGYAPGNYQCTCTVVTCRKSFIGDKRAIQCEECAIALVNEKWRYDKLFATTRKKNHLDAEQYEFLEYVNPTIEQIQQCGMLGWNQTSVLCKDDKVTHYFSRIKR